MKKKAVVVFVMAVVVAGFIGLGFTQQILSSMGIVADRYVVEELYETSAGTLDSKGLKAFIEGNGYKYTEDPLKTASIGHEFNAVRKEIRRLENRLGRIYKSNEIDIQWSWSEDEPLKPLPIPLDLAVPLILKELNLKMDRVLHDDGFRYELVPIESRVIEVEEIK